MGPAASDLSPRANESQLDAAIDYRKNEVIKIKFSTKDCSVCPQLTHCTRSEKKYKRRTITVRPQAQHEALQVARPRQQTPAFAREYVLPEGIEATISESVFVPLACAAPVILASLKPFQQNTPLGLTALPTDTIEVTDPTHPLYGLSFPLISITVKQRLGRVCLVWLHPGIERAIPVSVTNLAGEDQVLSSCRLSIAGLQALLHVLSSLVSPSQEDAHEPLASTQRNTASPSSTSLTVSRPRTDAVPSPTTSGGGVSPADLVDLVTGHATGSQNHPVTCLSGGARVFALAPNKITKRHRELEAYVYVRQSTLKQVQQNQESRHNQYALVQPTSCATRWLKS